MNHWVNKKNTKRKTRTFSVPLFYSTDPQETLIDQHHCNTDLDLSLFFIHNIPCSIKNLPISSLDLSYNEIAELPCFLYYMINLTKLDLKFNNITYVSQKINNLTNLKFLDISNNKIKFLPIEITEMEIENLKLQTNNFIGEDEVAKLNSKNVIQLPTLECIVRSEIIRRNIYDVCELLICSICKRGADTPYKLYKIMKYNGDKIPFEYNVCGIGCFRKFNEL